MSILDNEKIINGTPDKVFNSLYSKMKENYNQVSANEFYNSYKNQPLSFILNNSRKIFSEPFYGYQFYKKIVVDYLLPPTDYETELNKVESYIDEARGKVSDEQLALYEELKDYLAKKVAEYKYTIKITKFAKKRNADSYIGEFYDTLFNLEKRGDTDSFEDLAESLGYLNDPYTFFAIGSHIFSRYPRLLGKTMYKYSKNHYKKYNKNLSESAMISTLESVYAISNIYHDQYIQESLNYSDNINFTYMYKTIANSEIDDYKKLINESVIKDEYIPVSTALNVFNRMYEAMDELSVNDDNIMVEKYDKLYHTKAVYEFLINKGILEENDQEYFESIFDKIYNIEAEMEFLEWQSDGELNPVIKERNITRQEKEEEEKERQKLLEKESKKGNHQYISTDDKEDDENNEDNEDTSKKTKNNKDKKSTEDIDSTDDNDDDDDFSDIVTEAEDEAEDTDISSSPKKPEEDITLKIQNKALDMDAKRKEKQGIRREKNQRLKNAANAISAGPRGIIENLRKIRDDFDKWDDERRERYMIQPGFRKKIFKNMKLALLYGGVAQYNIMSLPYFMIIRHFSKDKDRRIRNELVRELDTEIKIAEEKISDANSKGDNNEKYRLMRIKEKLLAEKQRVSLNSKYI